MPEHLAFELANHKAQAWGIFVAGSIVLAQSVFSKSARAAGFFGGSAGLVSRDRHGSNAQDCHLRGHGGGALRAELRLGVLPGAATGEGGGGAGVLVRLVAHGAAEARKAVFWMPRERGGFQAPPGSGDRKSEGGGGVHEPTP